MHIKILCRFQVFILVDLVPVSADTATNSKFYHSHFFHPYVGVCARALNPL